jgi:nicotinate-nucleotide pyrophosphorylase (carboxylating)
MNAAYEIGSLNRRAVEDAVLRALAEDAPWGDITSQTLIPGGARLSAKLVAREPGVLSGTDVFAAAMTLTDPATEVKPLVTDGSRFERGTVLASVSGSARSVLTAERVALNFVQRMSGIATMTAQFVAAVAGTKAHIVDTRKTTPGLRLFERYAVRCGGGHNHRFSLSDAVLAKDNHLAVLTRRGERSLTEALREVRAALPHTTHLEVEVDRPDQIASVLDAGVDTIMLDNFTPEQMRAAVQLIGGRALIEASGSVKLDQVRAIAETGVDIISVGALTHGARALDLGLDAVIELSGPAQ